MGWTTTHKPANVSAKEYIERELLVWTSPTHSYRVLDGGVKNFRTYYGAVEKVELKSGKRDVFAVIILLSYSKDYYNFGYKDMSEDMGPYQADCPERILNLLTPTDNANANAWRKQCRDRIEQSRQKKQSVIVGSQLAYGGNDYTVTELLGRSGARVVNSVGQIYRMRNSQIKQAKILA